MHNYYLSSQRCGTACKQKNILARDAANLPSFTDFFYECPVSELRMLQTNIEGFSDKDVYG